MSRMFAAAIAAGWLALFAVAAHAGPIGDALSDAQRSVINLVVGGAALAAFVWVAAKIDARAKVAAAKSPLEQSLMDKAAIEADRRLDAIDRDHLKVVIENVLMANADRLAATLNLPPKAAADDFVDDFLAALRDRNPKLAARLPLDERKIKDLIAAGIGRATAPDRLAAALEKMGGLARVYG